MTYYSEDIVQKMTKEVMDKGHSILQVYKMDADDHRHAEILLKIMDVPLGSSILDAGCGIGTVAKYMHEIRSDINFTLLNISPYQLSLCPEYFTKICADFHDVPVVAKSFDVVMFNYAMGHADLMKMFSECRRLLKDGGTLFIYDLEGSECQNLTSKLNYIAYPIPKVLEAAQGFKIEVVGRPNYATSEHMNNLLDNKTYQEIFNHLQPVIYKFRKVTHA